MAEIPEYGVTGEECATCNICYPCLVTPTPDMEAILLVLIALAPPI